MRKALFLVLVVPSLASADRRIELGITVGGHAFSENTELGVADHMSEPGATSSGLLGLRVAVPLMKRLAAEAEAIVIPTEDDVLGEEVTVFGLRTHARFDLLTGRVKPFVVAGVGAHVVRSDEPGQMDNDADRAYHWGGGVRVAITEKLDARVDARHLIVPDRTRDGATSDYELTAGVSYRFGKTAKPPVVVVYQPPPPPPPAPPPPPPPPVVEEKPLIKELAGIGFEHNSSTIDDASTPILDLAVTILKDNPKISVEISGHTSSEGDPDKNLSLSLKRAEAVKAYLVEHGIADTRIHTVGHGSDIAIADNATADGRAKNRRIEFRIMQASD